MYLDKSSIQDIRSRILVPSWSWSYGSWIYNYLRNHCLSPLMVWVRTSFMARCTGYNIMWQSLWLTCNRSVVLSGYSGFLLPRNEQCRS